MIVACIDFNVYIIAVIVSIMGIGTILILVPVTHKNKVINETLRKANKVRSLILYVGCCLISVSIAATHRSLSLTIIIALLQIIILMVVGRIKQGG